MGAASAKNALTTEVAKSHQVEPESSGLFKIEAQQTDFGRADSFKYNVLVWILDERYDKAITELKKVLETESEYPSFHSRVNRYINHSIDLVHAIKAKRNFPGIKSLTRAKQQELREKFRQHFKELQHILTRVENVEADLRITDARSTIYVVKAIWIAVVCVIGLAFFMEATNGLFKTTQVVADDLANKGVEYLFTKLGL
jgi:hypothetical protein